MKTAQCFPRVVVVFLSVINGQDELVTVGSPLGCAWAPGSPLTLQVLKGSSDDQKFLCRVIAKVVFGNLEIGR